MRRTIGLALTLGIATSVAAHAQEHRHADTPSDAAVSAVSPDAAFASQMMQAMKRMDADMMAAKPTGDPDRDFVAMMIPHHQGAIDMAKLQLMYGRNPVLRRLAQGIIVEQQQEIELMQRTLNELPATIRPALRLSTRLARYGKLRRAMTPPPNAISSSRVERRHRLASQRSCRCSHNQGPDISFALWSAASANQDLVRTGGTRARNLSKEF